MNKTIIISLASILVLSACTFLMDGIAEAKEIVVASSYLNELNAVTAYSRSSNEYLVVYARPWRGNFGINICVQRLDSAGKRIGGPLIIFSSTDHWVGFRPQICIAYNQYLSRYLVGWNWHQRSNEKWAIYTAKINFLGNLGATNL